MDKKKAALMLHDHYVKGESYRTLGKRYGVSIGTVHNMLKKARQDDPMLPEPVAAKDESPMPDEVRALKEALRVERLKNELLNAVIDVSSKELGIDLRKKHGTRQ